METSARFFESINAYLGIKGPEELLTNPWFIGICIVIFIYSFIKQWRLVYLIVGGGMGTVGLHHYLYPKSGSDLTGLISFLAATGALVLVLVYFAFVRD